MKRSLACLTTASAVTLGLALAGATLVPADAYAERGPDSYPSCAISGLGATICYYDTLAQCAGATGGCVENPGFDVGTAMARATSRHSQRARQ